MDNRLKEIRERLEGYSVVLKKDMMFLLDALEQAQEGNKILEFKLYNKSHLVDTACHVIMEQSKKNTTVTGQGASFAGIYFTSSN